jgi:hypothetical protein
LILGDSPLSDSSQRPVAILSLFRDITLMRRGPEELPASWPLLAITMVAQVVVALVLGSLLPALPQEQGVENHGVAVLFIETIVPLLWGWAILQFVGRLERFLQMMTAAFGCQLVLLPFAVPAIWAARYFGEGSSLLLLAQAAQVVLSIWGTVATARIVRAATDWPMAACVMLVVVQGLAVLLVALAFFPDLAQLMKQGS